jgi:phage terminase large subunit
MDDPEKIKSVQGVNRIWIEEATELKKEDFNQLDLRLR